MELTKTVNGSSAVIALSGRLDTTTAPELDTVLEALGGEVTQLVLDFEQLEYISSAGLRVLLKMQKAMTGHGSMKLIHVNETVMDIFEVTGFANLLTIE